MIAFLCAVTRLLQTWWGRALVYIAAVAYTIVALLHLVFFVYLTPLAPAPWDNEAKELKALQ